jgi:hypothetical protein
MANLKLPKSVKQVLVVGRSGNAVAPVVVYEPETKAKTSRFLRPIEKAARRFAKGQAAAASSYVERHKRSSTEEDNGWVKDLKKNIVKSVKVGKKAAKSKTA